jgi:nicotinate-nucleotide adenylyltransferase
MDLIGVFGGTFDPIHLGHLRTAYEILHRLDLAEVRFVPCRIPHDGKSPVAPTDLRLRMIREAVASESGFVVDERELDRQVNHEEPSYSIDTLESFRDEFPDRSFALIVGMDAFLGFTSWHRWEAILETANVIVARRPGSAASASSEIDALLSRHGTEAVGDLRNEAAGRILVHTVTQLEVSSSAIREMVREGIALRYLVPDGVQKIIDESGCYVGNPDKEAH